MNTALNMLAQEHENILKAIEALMKECGSMQAGKEINEDFLSGAIGFIKGYADKFHHAKEENILFKELNKNEANMHCNPVEQMLYEHDLGRNFVAGMEKGIAEKDKNKIIENASGYADLLRNHIYKEDHILYPMADEALSQEAKDKMLGEFKKVEENLNKEKEKYLAFIHQ